MSSFFKHQCNIYWAEAEKMPISAIVDYWCENDPICQKARFFALVAACEKGEVEYSRADGKDFRDPVLDLANRDILLIHRESFERWIQKFPEKKAGDILPLRNTTETVYLNIIGALIETMLAKSPAGKPFSVFESQVSIIDSLTAHFPGAPGIAKRTLEEKFAEGKRSLSATTPSPEPPRATPFWRKQQ